MPPNSLFWFAAGPGVFRDSRALEAPKHSGASPGDSGAPEAIPEDFGACHNPEQTALWQQCRRFARTEPLLARERLVWSNRHLIIGPPPPGQDGPRRLDLKHVEGAGLNTVM